MDLWKLKSMNEDAKSFVPLRNMPDDICESISYITSLSLTYNLNEGSEDGGNTQPKFFERLYELIKNIIYKISVFFNIQYKNVKNFNEIVVPKLKNISAEKLEKFGYEMLPFNVQAFDKFNSNAHEASRYIIKDLNDTLSGVNEYVKRAVAAAVGQVHENEAQKNDTTEGKIKRNVNNATSEIGVNLSTGDLPNLEKKKEEYDKKLYGIISNADKSNITEKATETIRGKEAKPVKLNHSNITSYIETVNRIKEVEEIKGIYDEMMNNTKKINEDIQHNTSTIEDAISKLKNINSTTKADAMKNLGLIRKVSDEYSSIYREYFANINGITNLRIRLYKEGTHDIMTMLNKASAL